MFQPISVAVEHNDVLERTKRREMNDGEWIYWSLAGLTVCLNTHVMDHEGRTVLVDKKCATERLCSSQVGCRRAGDQKVNLENYFQLIT